MSISEAALTLNGTGAAPISTPTPGARVLPTVVAPTVVAREAIVVAVAVAGLTALLTPQHLGAGLGPHPAWIAVLLLSARYGSRGFGFALVAVWGTLLLTALGMGLDLGPVVAAASNSVTDLAALVVCVLVAWIASTHERRIGELAGCRAELARKSAGDEATIGELRDAAVALRGRADRLDHSLSFIRDVAARLEGSDPQVAWQAALDLAIARTGARAGVVQLVDGDRLRTTASLGAWTAQRARPFDFFIDRTINAAFAASATVRARDLADAGSDDSDVAVPITDEAERILGILALRGVPEDSLCHALVHDLELVARWSGKGKTSTSPDAAVVHVTTQSSERDQRSSLAGLERGPSPRPQELN